MSANSVPSLVGWSRVVLKGKVVQNKPPFLRSHKSARQRAILFYFWRQKIINHKSDTQTTQQMENKIEGQALCRLNIWITNLLLFLRGQASKPYVYLSSSPSVLFTLSLHVNYLFYATLPLPYLRSISNTSALSKIKRVLNRNIILPCEPLTCCFKYILFWISLLLYTLARATGNRFCAEQYHRFSKHYLRTTIPWYVNTTCITAPTLTLWCGRFIWNAFTARLSL